MLRGRAHPRQPQQRWDGRVTHMGHSAFSRTAQKPGHCILSPCKAASLRLLINFFPHPNWCRSEIWTKDSMESRTCWSRGPKRPPQCHANQDLFCVLSFSLRLQQAIEPSCILIQLLLSTGVEYVLDGRVSLCVHLFAFQAVVTTKRGMWDTTNVFPRTRRWSIHLPHF